MSPLLFVKFMEAFPEHCFELLTALAEQACSCLERKHKKLQLMGLLVAALRLLQLDLAPKEELCSMLTSLRQLSLKMLTETKDGKGARASLALELCDLLLLVSRYSLALGLQNPLQGDSVLESTLTCLKGARVSKQLNSRINAVLREIKRDSTTPAKHPKKRKRSSLDSQETC